MPIEVRCTCGKQLQAPDEAKGKNAQCPHCGKTLKVGEPLPPWDPRERAQRAASRKLPRPPLPEEPERTEPGSSPQPAPADAEAPASQPLVWVLAGVGLVLLLGLVAWLAS